MNKRCVYYVVSFLPENSYSGELPICLLKIRVSSAHVRWTWGDHDEHLGGDNKLLVDWMAGWEYQYLLPNGSWQPCALPSPGRESWRLSTPTPTPNWEGLWRLGQVVDSRKRLSVSNRRSKKTQNTKFYLTCVDSAILNLSFLSIYAETFQFMLIHSYTFSFSLAVLTLRINYWYFWT